MCKSIFYADITTVVVHVDLKKRMSETVETDQLPGMYLIAWKSDAGGLLKTWFSVKNFTEKSRTCQFDFGRFFYFQWFDVRVGLRGLFHIRDGLHIRRRVWLTIMNANRQKISVFFKRQAVGVWIDPIYEPLKWFSEVLFWKSRFQ